MLGTTEFVFVGHSKGATIAELVARPDDGLVVVSGRARMSSQPKSRWTEEELSRINRGETVEKRLGSVVF